MCPDHPLNAGNRREFLRRAALGGIIGVAGTLGVRSAREKCINAGICRGCAAYDACNLPQALSAKQVLDGKPLR